MRIAKKSVSGYGVKLPEGCVFGGTDIYEVDIL